MTIQIQIQIQIQIHANDFIHRFFSGWIREIGTKTTSLFYNLRYRIFSIRSKRCRHEQRYLQYFTNLVISNYIFSLTEILSFTDYNVECKLELGFYVCLNCYLMNPCFCTICSLAKSKGWVLCLKELNSKITTRKSVIRFTYECG